MIGKEPCALDDSVFRDRLREIVTERGIKVAVETGVHKGWSTCALSEMVETVFGIDNNLAFLAEAYQNIHERGCKNAVLCVGNSPDVLRALLPSLPDETLFFLDAHWQSYWPLRDEIKSIRPNSGTIVLHDVVVPGHPELGFDTYGGQSLCYEYVREALTAWSRHRIEYNERAEGTEFPRGVMYVFPW